MNRNLMLSIDVIPVPTDEAVQEELQDDLTTKYGKKGGFETPEEAEKSYWEYEKRYQKKQRNLQIAKMQKTDVMLGDYLEYWFENRASVGKEAKQ